MSIAEVYEQYKVALQEAEARVEQGDTSASVDVQELKAQMEVLKQYMEAQQPVAEGPALGKKHNPYKQTAKRIAEMRY